jgi:hypothetical protein
MAIAALLIWNLVIVGVLVRQMRRDHLPTAEIGQTVGVTVILAIVVIVWLLRNSRRPNEGTPP